MNSAASVTVGDREKDGYDNASLHISRCSVGPKAYFTAVLLPEIPSREIAYENLTVKNEVLSCAEYVNDMH